MVTAIIATTIFFSGLISFFLIGKLFYNRNTDDIMIVEEDSLIDLEIAPFKNETKGEEIKPEITQPKKKRGRKPKTN